MRKFASLALTRLRISFKYCQRSHLRRFANLRDFLMNQEYITKPVLSAAVGLQPIRQPIWFLRQAGRYLPEYQEIRKKMSFVDLCRTPKMAAEVTLQPLRRFDLDAAIIFSDILILPTAMGLNLSFDSDHGPLLKPTIRSSKDMLALNDKDIAKKLDFVGEAIELVRPNLNESQTLIGFAGAPFTVASYMIEGSGSKNYSHVKQLAFNQPKTFSNLLNLIAELTFEYLHMQVKAGAEIVMLFDSWASHFSGQDYRELIFNSVATLVAKLRSHNIPVIYYPGQGSHLLSQLSGLKANIIAVDWRPSLKEADLLLQNIGESSGLQGNLDPQALSGSQNYLEQRVLNIMKEANEISSRRHIFNVGHGLLPNTPINAIEKVIDIVRSYKN